MKKNKKSSVLIDDTIFWENLKSGDLASKIKESSKGNMLANALKVFNIMKPTSPENMLYPYL